MIFVDLDGPLTDLVPAALRVHGRTEPLDTWWPRGTYEMHDALGMTKGDFWAPIEKLGMEFWAELPMAPHAEELLGIVRRTGQPWKVLTSPTDDPACAAGKTVWMKRYFGQTFREYMIGRDKWICARREHDVLIDDDQANCDGFIMAGGAAVVFPTLWNPEHERYADPCMGMWRELQVLANL